MHAKCHPGGFQATMHSKRLLQDAFEATVLSKYLPEGAVETTVRSKWLSQGSFQITTLEMAAPGAWPQGAFEATVHLKWQARVPWKSLCAPACPSEVPSRPRCTLHGPLLAAPGALASAPQGVQRSSSKHRCSASLSLVSLHSGPLQTMHGYARVHPST